MTARTCLSKWLQPHFNKFANFGAASKSLASFFKVDSYVGHQRLMAVQRQTEMMQKSKAQVKRSHKSSDDSEEDSKPKLEVLQDIYNVQSGGEKPVVASSIYAQSSKGIDFSCSQKQESGGEGKVAVNPAPKRKKIVTTWSVNFDLRLKSEMKKDHMPFEDVCKYLKNTYVPSANFINFKD